MEDIAAMKLITISRRGKKRDFIDIYFLIKEFGLDEIIEMVRKKYPNFNIYVGLQRLIYFEDAEKDREKRQFRLVKDIVWGKLKKFILKEVDEYTHFYLKE